VPAGHPDGGQWTATGGSGTRLAAADKPRPGGGGIIAIAVQLALRAIEAYRVKERLWDLLGNKEGVIAVTTIDGEDIFGANSESRAYTSADFAAAKKLRDTLVKKYPTTFSAENPGKAPSNARFEIEGVTTIRFCAGIHRVERSARWPPAGEWTATGRFRAISLRAQNDA
jgi:hypothetical protein